MAESADERIHRPEPQIDTMGPELVSCVILSAGESSDEEQRDDHRELP
jgi:hypothetical protein